MGFGGISVWSLLLILVIVILLFGTKRLRSMGSDLGSALKNFKKSVKDGTPEESAEDPASKKVTDQPSGNVIEGQATEKNKDKA